MADMTARDIMTPDPITVGPEMTVTDAAQLMTEKHVGALPVAVSYTHLTLPTIYSV